MMCDKIHSLAEERERDNLREENARLREELKQTKDILVYVRGLPGVDELIARDLQRHVAENKRS